MAVKDVRNYYLTMQAQYLEMKEDLADYDQAFKDGHITEDQLEIIKEEIADIETNYNRLRYIIYLLSLPNKKQNKKRFLNSRQAKQTEEYFKNLNATSAAVEAENNATLEQINSEINELI